MTVAAPAQAPVSLPPAAQVPAPLERVRRRLTGLSIRARLPEILLVAGRLSC